MKNPPEAILYASTYQLSSETRPKAPAAGNLPGGARRRFLVALVSLDPVAARPLSTDCPPPGLADRLHPKTSNHDPDNGSAAAGARKPGAIRDAPRGSRCSQSECSAARLCEIVPSPLAGDGSVQNWQHNMGEGSLFARGLFAKKPPHPSYIVSPHRSCPSRIRTRFTRVRHFKFAESLIYPTSGGRGLNFAQPRAASKFRQCKWKTPYSKSKPRGGRPRDTLASLGVALDLHFPCDPAQRNYWAASGAAPGNEPWRKSSYPAMPAAAEHPPGRRRTKSPLCRNAPRAQ